MWRQDERMPSVILDDDGQAVAWFLNDKDARGAVNDHNFFEPIRNVVRILAGAAPSKPDCIRCQNESGRLAHLMILCPKCGNKRCPKATDHRNACTGSNEPGQVGSLYPPLPEEE